MFGREKGQKGCWPLAKDFFILEALLETHEETGGRVIFTVGLPTRQINIKNITIL